jgi:hypothetical protein
MTILAFSFHCYDSLWPKKGKVTKKFTYVVVYTTQNSAVEAIKLRIL